MKNVGMLDRIIRFLVGLLLIWLGYSSLMGTWQWVAYIVGAILVLVAIFSFCPLYKLFGMSTCKKCGMKKEEGMEMKQEMPSEEAPQEEIDNNIQM